MKITTLKQQVKDQGRISVFLDGQYSFSLSLDELADTKIKNGDELTAAEVKKLKKISTDGKLRARALEWLLNRPHSSKEFQDYMLRKKAEPELASRLQEEFTTKGYLSDEKYATWLVELRSRKAKSNRAIRAELISKGISREIVNTALENSVDENERLQSLVEKKKNLNRYKNNSQKFVKYLVSQGFAYSEVKKIINPKDT